MEKSTKLVSEIGQIAQLLCIVFACVWHTTNYRITIYFAQIRHTFEIKTVDLAEMDSMVVYLFF